jgi:hypothetical protein
MPPTWQQQQQEEKQQQQAQTTSHTQVHAAQWANAQICTDSTAAAR